jgi:hypothetical protein
MRLQRETFDMPLFLVAASKQYLMERRRSAAAFPLYSVSIFIMYFRVGYDGVRLTYQNCSLYRPIVHPRVIAMWTMV